MLHNSQNTTCEKKCLYSYEFVDKYINEMECAIFHISKLAKYIFSLMKKDIELITISYSSSGIQIALNSESEISVYDNDESKTDRTI